MSVAGPTRRDLSKLEIPEKSVRVGFARSEGPGGQGVNKTNSKAVLRWNLWDHSPSFLSIEEKTRIYNKIKTRSIYQEKTGDVIIVSQRQRDWHANRRDALRKLKGLIIECLKEEKPRKATRQSASSRRRDRERQKRDRIKVRERRRNKNFDVD